MPLPPYIKAELQDNERYQTVYSKVLGPPPAHRRPALHAGAAAPGGGDGVRLCYVTLHVGLGPSAR